MAAIIGMLMSLSVFFILASCLFRGTMRTFELLLPLFGIAGGVMAVIMAIAMVYAIAMALLNRRDVIDVEDDMDFIPGDRDEEDELRRSHAGQVYDNDLPRVASAGRRKDATRLPRLPHRVTRQGGESRGVTVCGHPAPRRPGGGSAVSAAQSRRKPRLYRTP